MYVIGFGLLKSESDRMRVKTLWPERGEGFLCCRGNSIGTEAPLERTSDNLTEMQIGVK
jgi:hypothetical protein